MEHNHESHYNSFTAPDGNIVWAGALTLAWKELLHLTPDTKQLTIKNANPHVESIANNFNESPFSKNELDKSSYYVKSGFGQVTVEEINK